jgi:hypothetical protein
MVAQECKAGENSKVACQFCFSCMQNEQRPYYIIMLLSSVTLESVKCGYLYKQDSQAMQDENLLFLITIYAC